MTGTRRLVLRLLPALLTVLLVTLAGAVVTVELSRRDANALHSGEAPAREGLAAARQSLVEADTRAVSQFDDLMTASTDDRPEPGPGDRYRTAVDAAGRQLAQVSQADVDESVTEAVQTVNGLLLTYDGLIQRAFRAPASDLLSLVNLKNAHQFLQEEILPQLTVLQARVDRMAGPGPAWPHLWWQVPLVVLAALLTVTQVVLSRRFRRTLSVPLLAASVLTVALAVVAGQSREVGADVQAGRARLSALVGDYRQREYLALDDGCAALKAVSATWPSPVVTCATGIETAPDDRDVLSKANAVSTAARDASAAALRNAVVVVLLGGLIALLIIAGLLPRIEEYRYRSR